MKTFEYYIDKSNIIHNNIYKYNKMYKKFDEKLFSK